MLLDEFEPRFSTNNLEKSSDFSGLQWGEIGELYFFYQINGLLHCFCCVASCNDAHPPQIDSSS